MVPYSTCLLPVYPKASDLAFLDHHIYSHQLARTSAQQSYIHPSVVDEYLSTKLAQSQMVGPFMKQTVPQAHINRLELSSKSTQTSGD